MQTIETRYLGPSNTKPGRIRATASGGASALVSYAHDATSVEAAHAQAAEKLRAKMKWDAMYLAGSTQRGYVFAFPPTPGDIWIGR